MDRFLLFPLIFALALATALVPIATTQTLPLLDWPNHLGAHAMCWRDIGDSPLLQQIYDVRWRPVPNLAMDLIVPFLGHTMPLEWAGRLFIALTFLLMAGGVALVHRQLFGRFSYWPLLAFLFLYDRSFLLGLVNYLFGLGPGAWSPSPSGWRWHGIRPGCAFSSPASPRSPSISATSSPSASTDSRWPGSSSAASAPRRRWRGSGKKALRRTAARGPAGRHSPAAVSSASRTIRSPII